MGRAPLLWARYDLILKMENLGIMGSRDEAYLQIGEVAERTGVTQRTLRFYEEKGLLKPPTRMEGVFRLYSEEDVRRVERIRRLQSLLGICLADIREMVEAEEVLREMRAQYLSSADVIEKRRKLESSIEVLERQYAIVRQKTEQLLEMRTQLEERLKTLRQRAEELQRLEAETAMATP